MHVTATRIDAARWVLPIEGEPVPDGAVVRRGGTILEVGAARAVRARYPEAELHDHGAAILLPGLVNAHTHLSLTGLAATIPKGEGFLGWLGRTARAAQSLTEDDVRRAVREGLEESHRLGTALVGEVTTRADGVDEILAHPSMRARVYFEFLGVSEARATARLADAQRRALALRAAARGGAGDATGDGEGDDRVRAGLSPHAPYSVWPAHWSEAARFTHEHDLRWTSHVAEPADEAEFLLHGTGPLRAYLESLGVWDGSFPIPAARAVEMLDRAGALDERALLVHAVHFDESDAARVAARGASVCLCPRSNATLGLPPPPAAMLLKSGVNLCLGTDSKAGNEDLSVWAEMRALAEIAPEIPPRRLVEMATRDGARALGFDGLAGTLTPGGRSPMVRVKPGRVRDDDPYRILTLEPVEEAVSPL